MAYSRSEYLKQLNKMRSNYQNNGNAMINTMDDSTAVGEELSSFAYMNTPTPAMPMDTIESVGNESTRNGWQRTMDTIEEAGSNIRGGLLNFFDGIGDFLIGISGKIGSIFGGDDQWAKDAIQYDWVSQANEALGAFNTFDIFSGDVFTGEFYNDLGKIGSSEGAQELAQKRSEGSWVSEGSQGFQNIYKGATEGIGYVLPSIVLGIATGGASTAVQTAAGVGMLLASGVSAAGSGTEEALGEGASLGQALGSGAIAGTIEIGVEALSFGIGKLAGKILGKTTSWGTKIAGTQFVQAIANSSVAELGKTALEEGTEELITELLRPFTKTPYKGAEAFQEYKDPQLYTDALISFTSGAIAGSVASGVQTQANYARYSKAGCKGLSELGKGLEIKQKANQEAKKGNKANQELIQEYEKQAGEKIKSFMTTMEDLKTSNPKAFENVMGFLQNENGDLDAMKKQLGRSTYDDLAEEAALKFAGMDNIKKDGSKVEIRFATPSEIEFARKKDNSFNKSLKKAVYLRDENGNHHIAIDPKAKSDFYQAIAHEGLVHMLLDDTEGAKHLENYILKDSKLNKAYHKHDAELQELYGDDQKTLSQERMARFLEDFVQNDKDLQKVIGINTSKSLKSKIKNLLNKFKLSLDPRRDKKLLLQVNKAIKIASKTNTDEQVTIAAQKGTLKPVVKFSRVKVSGVQASKDYAQHMQSKVIDLKTTNDIYNLMVEGLSQTIGADITIKGKQNIVDSTTIAFNTLLNRPRKLQAALTGVLDNVLQSNIQYQIVSDPNSVAIDVNTTLEKHLTTIGFDIDTFKTESVKILEEILKDNSNDSKIKKMTDYFKMRISSLQNKVMYYKSNSYYTIKSMMAIEKIKERIDVHTLPNVANKPGDIHFAELTYYKGLTKGIGLSKSKQGISPKSIDHLVSNFSSYTEDNLKNFKWIQYDNEIREAVDFLASKQVDGKFPNRSLTLEENQAVLDILSRVSKDMKSLIEKETIERHKRVEKADVETKIVHDVNHAKSGVNIFQRELDFASSVDIIFGRYYGTNSDTYRILYKDPMDAYDAQLLKTWEFLGEHDGIKKELEVKDGHLTKKYIFKGVKMTADDLLDIYVQSQTDIGLQTLLEGGYNYESKKGKTIHLKLDSSDITDLENMLPDKIKKLGTRVLNEQYNGSLKEYKSEADIRIKGVPDVLKEDLYYPTNKDETSSFNTEGIDYQRLDVSKTSINRQRNNVTSKPIKGMSFSGRFKAYVNAITKYSEMYEVLKTFSTFMNQYTTMDDGRKAPRSAIMFEIDENFQSYMNYYSSQILGVPFDKSNIGENWMFKSLVSATLTGNLSVVLKQTASIPTIMMEVKFSSWIRALVSSGGKFLKYKQTKANLKLKSGLLAQRFNDSDAVKAKTLSANIGKIAKFFGVPMKVVDEAVIITFAYTAAQYEAEALGFGKVGTDSNEVEAIKILNRIVTNTQSNAIPMKMSMNRAGAGGKSSTSRTIRKVLSYFTSDLQNKINYLNLLLNEKKSAKRRLVVIDKKLDQIEKDIQTAQSNGGDVDSLLNTKEILLKLKQEAEASIKGGTDRKALKMMLSTLLSALILASIEELVDRIYGRKGWDEDTTDTFAIALILEATFNNLPYISPIINSIEYDTELGTFDFGVIQAFVDVAKDIAQGKTLGKTIFDLADAVGTSFGIPAKNLYNLIMGIWKNVNPYGYKLDAILKGYSDSYIYSQYRDAVDNGRNNQAKGLLKLVYAFKTGSSPSVVLNEVNRLYKVGYNCLPKNAPTDYTNEKGNTVKVTPTQNDTFMKYYSTSNEDVEKLLNISDYTSLDSESKSKVIKKIYDAYYDYAKMKAIGSTSSNKLVNLLAVTKGRLGLSKFVIGVNALSNIEAIGQKTRKELVLEQINKMKGYTKAEKLLLVYLSGFSLTDSNKASLQLYLTNQGASLKDAQNLIS